MDLQYLDSLARRWQVLGPPRGRPLALYVCGPTVYDQAHVGHARTYLLFDTVKRFFLAQGARVGHVQNITDFEDKLTRRALKLGVSWKELARREERSFVHDMASLGVIPPGWSPRSSDYVSGIIEAIRSLEKRKIAYRKGRSVYFDASAVPASGGNFSADAMLSAHAVPEPGQSAEPEAEDPRDFVLWKPSSPPSPVWPSPWGKGMPGWHLECYVMASSFLPLPLDLHGGGLDLMFPHHYAENLISYGLRRSPFSKGFLHGGFVTMGERKMSKSLGNLITIREALDEICAPALRWYVLSKSYRDGIEYLEMDARSTDAMWHDLQRTFHGLLDGTEAEGYPVERLERSFAKIPRALALDLDIPQALSALQATAADIQAFGRGGLDAGDRARGRKVLLRMQDLLGLPLMGHAGAPA
ncbi:MAG: class I tRNA ligase family protein [Euryarchaeota archaeon]|nr:class I tRNA ligase family protein [Euryarchaeota archaeon]